MGKSRKRNNKRHDTGYPYNPIRISNVQMVRPTRRRSEDNGITLVHPVFKSTGGRPLANQKKQQHLKRLQFVASYAEYWWGKVCDVYMTSRQLAPGNLSPSLSFMEDKFVAMTLPFFMAVQQQSFETLRQMDAKVDAFLTGPVVEQLEGSSSKSWTQQDEQGKALYLQHETEVLANMISAAWARLVSLPAVDKVLESAQPSVDFTRRKYADAHDALVSSATYSKAMEAAEAIVSNFKHSFVYRTAAARLYPVVSSFTDPALDCIVQSQYYSAVVDHLRPVSPPAYIQAAH